LAGFSTFQTFYTFTLNNIFQNVKPDVKWFQHRVKLSVFFEKFSTYEKMTNH
jgi:hypothetical protein